MELQLDKTEKEKLFSAYLKKWCDLTWAGWWKINVLYKDAQGFYESEDETVSTKTIAVCHTDWRYMHARIVVNSAVLETLSEEEIEETAIHELMHVFLNEMREDGIDHEERVATFLARSFMFAGGIGLDKNEEK